MAKSEDLKHRQFEATINEVFTYLLTNVPHKIQSKGEKVATLRTALKRNQCYSENENSGKDTALDMFAKIAKGIKKHKDSRAVLITWLEDVDKHSNKILELQEKIVGMKILLEKPETEKEKEKPIENNDAIEWFKTLCLKPNGVIKTPGPMSLYNSMFKALTTECIEKIAELNISNGKELHKILEKSLLENPIDSKITKECLPGNTSWADYVRNNHGLPFCLLAAPKMLSVNIRLLCFPSTEEVFFYSPNSDACTIDIGLIGKDQYVALVKVTHVDDGGKMNRLKQEILDLKAEIARLKELLAVSKKEKEELAEKIKETENHLRVKEEEFQQIISNLVQSAAQKIQQAMDETRARVTQELVSEMINLP